MRTMTKPSSPEAYVDFSHWDPRTRLYWVLRPQKAVRRFFEERVPMSVRVRTSEDPRLAGRNSLTWWSYDAARTGQKLLLTFESDALITNNDARWRVIASALWRFISKDPTVVFKDVPVELADGCGPEVPSHVFCFARLRGAEHALIPNPYLLKTRKAMAKALPWEAKTDTLYFRGADSGSPDVDLNTRVALCRAAAPLPRTDCKITRLVQGGASFNEAVRREGLVSRRVTLSEMNRHRFLIDTDGNTTSWDRYMWTGTFGGVPIRFEPTWEECWHPALVEGENYISADRHSLGEVLARLRSDDALARHLAAGAARVLATHLSPKGVQDMFETAWRARCEHRGASRPAPGPSAG